MPRTALAPVTPLTCQSTFPNRASNANEKLKTKWAALEGLVVSEKRISLIAEDFVQHFERRLEEMDSKAMGVCMSRRICVDLSSESSSSTTGPAR